MEDYISAINTAFTVNFPFDVIEFMLQRIRSMEHGAKQFDINTLWTCVSTTTPKHIEKLLRCGADINYRLPNGNSTPIMLPAQQGKADCVSYMIEQGADLTIKNNAGYDVYIYATQGKLDINSIMVKINDNKVKDELVKQNQILEKQCQEMNGKLNYLFGMFEKLNMSEMIDLSHKKMKSDGNQ